MSREIVVWCDPHQAEGERIPGKEFRLAIDGRAPRLLAFCEEHQKEILQPLLDLLEEHGQPILDQPPGLAGETFPCSLCDFDARTKGGLSLHQNLQHGIQKPGKRPPSQADIEAAPLSLICQECGFIAERPQGLGIHKRHAHGIVGASGSAARWRAARGADRERAASKA